MPTRLAPALLLILLTGCITPSRAPQGYLAGEGTVSSDPRGAWAVVQTTDEQRHAGELLAVHADSVLVITPADRVLSVARAEIERLRVEAYRNNSEGARGWAAVGALSTLSHGFFFSLTLPVWGVTGAVASLDESGAGFLFLKPESLGEARPFARYPQGMPPGLDRSRLVFGTWP